MSGYTCNYGHLLLVRRSWADRSPGRRFVRCPNYGVISAKGNLRNLRANTCQFPCLQLTHYPILNQASLSPPIPTAVSVSNARFRIHNLGSQLGSRKKAKRKSGGHSVAQGERCGFGMWCQKSRSGAGVGKGFEGGHMTLYRHRIGKLRGITGEIGAPLWTKEEEESSKAENLTPGGEVYQKTLRLVECSMFAALGGLTYILSSSLAIENYFGCFFALPIVFSSMRWDIVAGRKTMVATATLLLVLSGPIKALTYMLMYGFLGLSMGSLWRLRASWGLSIFVSSLVRALGALGYVVIYSFLIRENILALITINIHASLTYVLTNLGFCTVPSMSVIYTIFGTLVILNSGFFVFLLHILYAVFFARLRMKDLLRLPRWLENAL